MVLCGGFALRHSWGWRAMPAAWWLYVPAGAVRGVKNLRGDPSDCARPWVFADRFYPTLAAVTSVQPRAVPRVHGGVDARYGGGVKL